MDATFEIRGRVFDTVRDALAEIDEYERIKTGSDFEPVQPSIRWAIRSIKAQHGVVIRQQELRELVSSMYNLLGEWDDTYWK